MRSTHRFSRYTGAFPLAVAWLAHAAPAIEIKRIQEGEFQVRVATSVAVDLKTAWQVLADYDQGAPVI
jgi:hypothetical protein